MFLMISFHVKRKMQIKAYKARIDLFTDFYNKETMSYL